MSKRNTEEQELANLGRAFLKIIRDAHAGVPKRAKGEGVVGEKLINEAFEMVRKGVTPQRAAELEAAELTAYAQELIKFARSKTPEQRAPNEPPSNETKAEEIPDKKAQ